MLATIPRRLLTDTVVFRVPSGIDAYQKQTYTEKTVYHCHIQNSNETRKSTDNTEVVLRAVLFVDARVSSPRHEYIALQGNSQGAGALLSCSVTDKAGNTTGAYTVLTVDAVPDDFGNVHHYELGLV